MGEVTFEFRANATAGIDFWLEPPNVSGMIPHHFQAGLIGTLRDFELFQPGFHLAEDADPSLPEGDVLVHVHHPHLVEGGRVAFVLQLLLRIAQQLDEMQIQRFSAPI